MDDEAGIPNRTYTREQNEDFLFLLIQAGVKLEYQSFDGWRESVFGYPLPSLKYRIHPNAPSKPGSEK